MTIRAPVITPPRVVDSPIARQFVSAGLALLTAVSLPVGQAVGRELPPPQKPYIDKAWPRQRNLPLQPTTLLPRGKAVGRELPAPKRPYVDKSWVQQSDLPLQLAVTLPALPSDWPIPKKLGAVNYDAQYQNVTALNTPVVVVTLPFSQLDWPLTRKVVSSPPDAVGVEALSLTFTGQPFAWMGWTDPRGNVFRTPSDGPMLAFGGMPPPPPVPGTNIEYQMFARHKGRR